jgi:hypothetical protein
MFRTSSMYGFLRTFVQRHEFVAEVMAVGDLAANDRQAVQPNKAHRQSESKGRYQWR